MKRRTKTLSYAHPDGAVAFRVVGGQGRIRFPPVCCECLVPTDHTWAAPSVLQFKLKIPICPTCKARWVRKRRLLTIYTLAIAWSCLAALIIWLKPPSLLAGAAAFAAGMVMGCVPLYFVLHYLGEPVITAHGARYGVDQAFILFRNRDFTALLVQAQILPDDPVTEVSFPVPPAALKEQRKEP